jgi:hypothetical protein
VTIEADDLLAMASDEARAIFGAFDRTVRRCGPVRVHATKTRIAFITVMTFAGAILHRKHVDISLILDDWIDDLRFRRIEGYGPRSFGHTVRVTDPREIDDQLTGWIGRAYSRGGQAGVGEPWMGDSIEVSPRRTDDRFQVGFRTGLAAGTIAAADVPRWVATLFGEIPVRARIARTDFDSEVRETENGAIVPLPGEAPSGRFDVFLRPGI